MARGFFYPLASEAPCCCVKVLLEGATIRLPAAQSNLPTFHHLKHALASENTSLLYSKLVKISDFQWNLSFALSPQSKEGNDSEPGPCLRVGVI